MDSLYIHIPFCLSKCAYCDFFSVTGVSDDFMQEYAAALSNEIKYRLQRLEPCSNSEGCVEAEQTGKSEPAFVSRSAFLKTVYIGGGTPSILPFSALKTIFSSFMPYTDSNTEITMEMNADDVTDSLLEQADFLGVTRISSGLQAFSDSVLKTSCRRGGRESNLNAIKLIKSHWKKESSFDLIAALPGQRENELLEGLKILTENGVSHISLYSLTIEEETPLYKMLSAGKIFYDFEEADKMWLKGRDFLIEQGYEQYEVSNFYKIKGGKPCRHNLTYWNLKSYCGCGSGATGSFYSFETAEGKVSGFRYTNTRNLCEYVGFWKNFSPDEVQKPCFTENINQREPETLFSKNIPCEREILTQETLSFEFFMMGLRKKDGICLDEYRKRFSSEIPESIFRVMKKWENEGKACFYTAEEKEHFCMSRDGLIFLNQFLAEII